MLSSFIEILNRCGAAFVNFSWAMLIQSTLLIFALIVIDFLVHKRVRAVFRYCIWMLVLAKLILPPSLALPSGIGYWCYLFGPATETATTYDSIENNIQSASASSLSKRQSAVNDESSFTSPNNAFTQTEVQEKPVAANNTWPKIKWPVILLGLWLAGVSIFIFFLLRRLRYVIALITQSQSADKERAEILHQCRQHIGLKQNIQLRLTDNMLSPAVCGLLRPMILLPKSILENLSNEQLRSILLHELAHIKRGDLWVNFLQTILQVFYFYNPLIWWANAKIRNVREQAVDEMVLVNLDREVRAYSNTLIDIAELSLIRPRLSLHLLGVIESKKALTERIRLMLNKPLPEDTRIGFRGLIALMISAALFLPMATAKNIASTTQATRYIKGKPELLCQAYQSMQENFEKLETWQANVVREEASYHTSEPGPKDKPYFRRIKEISFAKDRVHNMERVDVVEKNLKLSESVKNASEDPLRIFARTIRNSDDVFFSCRGTVQHENKFTLCLYEGSRHVQDDIYFQPMRYFWSNKREKYENYPKTLLNILNKKLIIDADNYPSLDTTVKVKDGKIYYSIINDKRSVENVYVYDPSKSGLLIKYYADDVRSFTKIEIDYEEYNGVWVPVKYSKRLVHRGKSKSEPPVTLIRILVFKDTIVNESIDPELFTLKDLGVKPGTVVNDRRNPDKPKIFKYAGQDLMETSSAGSRKLGENNGQLGYADFHPFKISDDGVSCVSFDRSSGNVRSGWAGQTSSLEMAGLTLNNKDTVCYVTPKSSKDKYLVAYLNEIDSQSPAKIIDELKAGPDHKFLVFIVEPHTKNVNGLNIWKKLLSLDRERTYLVLPGEIDSEPYSSEALSESSVATHPSEQQKINQHKTR